MAADIASPTAASHSAPLVQLPPSPPAPEELADRHTGNDSDKHKRTGVRSGRGGRALSGVRRADAARRMRREARARRGSRYSGDEALREDSRTKPPGAFRTTNGSETEHAPQARRRDATNSTRVANAARRAADSRAPDLRRGGLRRTRPRRQSQDCRAGRRTRKPPRIRAGSARLPPAVPHVVRHKDKGERQKLQTTTRRLRFANGLRNRPTNYAIRHERQECGKIVP